MSPARSEIAVGEQRFGLDPHRGGIGDMSCRVGHSELCRLDREVLKLGPVGVKAIEIATIENAKRDQRCQPLAVRRQFMDSDAPEINRERRDPFRLVFGEVGERYCAAFARGRRRNGLRDGAAVKGAPFASGDRLQRLRMSQATEELASRGRPTLRQEDPRELAKAAERRNLARPDLGDNRRDEKSSAGVADGRLEQCLERQAAEPPVQRHPVRNRAGYGRGIPAGCGHRSQIGEASLSPARRRTAGGVESDERAAGGDNGEGVAADAVRHRLDDGQRHGGRDRCVDRIAALGQHGEPRLRGKRLAGRDAIGG
jgi:hypothetical protein